MAEFGNVNICYREFEGYVKFQYSISLSHSVDFIHIKLESIELKDDH